MISYGLYTSEAEVWMHYHPRESRVYYYKVHAMRQHCSTLDRSLLAWSRDGRITGGGHLIKKWRDDLVTQARVPVISNIDWGRVTNRFAGMEGERLVILWLGQKVLQMHYWKNPPLSVGKAETLAEQYRGIDCYVRYECFGVPVEIKTETRESENLFVQTAEGRHNGDIAIV